MLIDDVKIALGITGNDFDGMLSDLIDSAKADMGVTNINTDNLVDTIPLYKRAIITYCRLNFSMFGLPDGYDALKKSYDEQKAQMSMSTGYTEWGNE